MDHIEPVVQNHWDDVKWDSNTPLSVGQLKFLVAQYNEPGRFYHTLEHILYCLNTLKSITYKTPYLREIRLALWFHDSVMKPTSQTTKGGESDEECSAILAMEMLGSSSAYDIELIKKLILSTSLEVYPESFEEKIVKDMDLAILGSNPKEYAKYEENIRKEYSYVPYNMYRAGRIEVLSILLSKDNIYYTDQCRELLGEAAIHNLGWEHKKLSI